MAKDPLIRDVVQSSVLKTHLNCHYLHQTVVEECSTTLLSSLGVKKLQTSDLIGILNSVAIRANNTGKFTIKAGKTFYFLGSISYNLFPLRGYCTPNLKLVNFVCYPKVINTIFEKLYMLLKANCPRNSKMALKFE